MGKIQKVFKGDPNKETVSELCHIDSKSFERLYKSYWKKVFGIIFHYTQDEEIAEEISQDLFASVWERRKTLVIRTSIEQYLSRAAKLEAFQYLRTSVNQQRHIDCALQGHCNSINCTEEQVLFNQLKGSLVEFVEQLPCRCREVYQMSHEQGLSNKTIALQLEISEKTVEYHLHKAMGFLRENLQKFRS